MRASWVVIVTAHILWVCGWLAMLGLGTPFAKADEVRDLSREMRADRIERLEQQIINTRIAQCRSEPNSAAREQYSERLQELIHRFREIAHEEPRVPKCDEV